MPHMVTRFDDLLDKVVASQTGTRRLVAIVGPPGSGKSTLSQALADRLNAGRPGSCAIVPMDGFHFDDEILRQRGRLDRKGAPDTFDVGGLLSLHRRLARNDEADIAVPLFDRERELSRAGARLIARSVETVLVEGNYLLLRQPGWDQLAGFYDLTVQIDVSEAEIERRLVERWRFHGLSPDAGRHWIRTNDLPNARQVITQSQPADLVYKAAA